MQRPTGLTIIALLFCGAGLYLWIIGAIQLISPGTLSMMAGKQFMYGLELAGPFMALLVGTGYALIAGGLFRLHKWSRWAAMIVMAIGIGWLVPKISMAELGVPVFWFGVQIALRVAVGWYLSQAPSVVDAFAAKAKQV
jgi:hypothetical protein